MFVSCSLYAMFTEEIPQFTDSYETAGSENSFRKIRKVFSVLLPQVVIFELKVSILESFELNIVIDVAYRFEVDSLALLLLTFVNLLTYVYYIRERKTSISGVEDRREFVTGEERLVTGRKGFVISRREYITVYKRE